MARARSPATSVALEPGVPRSSSAGAAPIWFTGLSGSGKTTIAAALVDRLRSLGRRVEFLDGDAIRSVFPETGFSSEERDLHIRRVGFLASRLEAHGVCVVASFISPSRASRVFVRGLCRRFVEVYVSTPLEVCEARDVKGLYARARRGELREFTGVTAPYEPPLRPEVAIDTTSSTIDENVGRILAHLGAD